MPAARSILCLPYAPVLGKIAANEARIAEIAHTIAAAETTPELIILPELALSGYLLESLTSMSPVTLADLQQFAQVLASSGPHARTEWIVGAPLREGNAVTNAAVVLCNGEILHIHRKLFLPTYGMFDEGRYFAPGTTLEFYEGVLGKTAIMVCEDAWHPELAFAASAAKADAVIVISASPGRGFEAVGSFESTLKWRHRLQTYAASYGQAYVYCNRAGVEDGILFDGSGFCLGHDATFLPEAGSSVYEDARLFNLKGSSGTRVGLAGSPAWQNEPPPFTNW
jgi:NAD+ synthase (glutamine-hydrolysing)